MKLHLHFKRFLQHELMHCHDKKIKSPLLIFVIGFLSDSMILASHCSIYNLAVIKFCGPIRYATQFHSILNLKDLNFVLKRSQHFIVHNT